MKWELSATRRAFKLAVDLLDDDQAERLEASLLQETMTALQVAPGDSPELGKTLQRCALMVRHRHDFREPRPAAENDWHPFCLNCETFVSASDGICPVCGDGFFVDIKPI